MDKEIINILIECVKSNSIAYQHIIKQLMNNNGYKNEKNEIAAAAQVMINNLNDLIHTMTKNDNVKNNNSDDYTSENELPHNAIK